MTRSVRIVLLAALMVIGLAAASYFCALRLCARKLASDDLAWLKREFRLQENEMQRIRQLHEGYQPKCREMCEKIAVKRAQLEKTLEAGESPDEQLVQLAALRAQCQAQMLRHFQDVSRAMPPQQGRRYLSEMERLTLGAHQELERSMTETAGSGHAHGQH